MRDHVKILGIVQIVFGALGAVGALVVLAIFGVGGAAVGMAAQQDPEAAMALPIIGAFGALLFLLILILSVPSIIAGVGLLKFRPWARILTIVLAALNLFNVPIGTALGIYGLWVMLNQETEQLFASGPPASPAVST